MLNILLIEDDALILANTKELLEANGYRVFSATNGRQGINLAQKLKPEIIICDIMMPEMNGYEVKMRLDKNPVTASIPFIFLTAKAELGDLRKGMNLGADDYLIKPFKFQDLIGAIESRIKRISNLKQHQNASNQQNKTRLLKDEKILLSVKKRPRLIKVSDIKVIEAKGVYSIINLEDDQELQVRKILKEWESVLPVEKFIRIHRSKLINIDYVDVITKQESGTLVVYVKNYKQPLSISKKYIKTMKQRFKI